MKRYEVSIIDSNLNVLEAIEMDRPCITRKEFKVIMESLWFNTLHYSNGYAVAHVSCNNKLLFDVSAMLLGCNTLTIAIFRHGKHYRSMLYRDIKLNKEVHK